MSGATERPGHTPMRDDSDSGRQRDVSTAITRRRALAGAGGLLVGGGAVAAVGSHPAAAVETTGFHAEDASASVPYDTNPEPELTASGPWQYERCDGADEVMTAVLVEGDLLASTEQDTTAPDNTGDYELTGVLTEVSAFEVDAFSPPKDGTREVEVPIEVRLEVRDPRGQTLADASASDSLTLTIDDSGVRVKADIGGSAAVSVPSNRSE
mgnify:FL=1